MTEAQLRQKFVDAVTSYLGVKEGSAKHREIVALYNSHKPLARGYALKETDAWCAGFVSAMAIACGLTKIIPTEVGIDKMIALYKGLGRWREDENYVPRIGDVVFYVWSDSGVGDNTASADHVGVVVEVTSGKFIVVEGNYDNAVKKREVTVNGRYLRGFGLPDFGSLADSESGSGSPSFAFGDIVIFTGTKHYASANGTSPSGCKPGQAKVTLVSEGAKHPYHLIKVTGGTSTVYGWVDTADIAGAGVIAKGSQVKLRPGAKTYTGGSLAAYVYDRTYTVLEISGDRAVIGIGGVVTAAVRAGDLTAG